MAASLISLTFDDALDEHLDVALPILNDAGLKVTFYAHLTAASLTRRMSEWRDLAQAGHELGNHTIFHPADIRKSWVREGNALDLYTLDRMDLELQVANDWLQAIDGQSERTFAYPCSNSILGSYGATARLLFRLGLRNTRWPGLLEQWHLDFGNTRSSYRTLMPKHFVAARGGGLHLSDHSPAFGQLIPDCLPSAAVEGHSFEEMRDFISRSLTKPTWAIIQFHGIGGGHRMDCLRSEFQKLITWLSQHHHDKVVTVVNGARRLFGHASKHQELNTKN
jgi:peptidoglycan/xylan/chitin deacetylase (PgdA/CDA1 family)